MNLKNMKQFILVVIVAISLLLITACSPTSFGLDNTSSDNTSVDNTNAGNTNTDNTNTDNTNADNTNADNTNTDNTNADNSNTDNTNSDDTGSDDANLDEVAIYSAVVRQIVETDDTFGGTLEKPVIYILSQTDDAAGDPALGTSESETLSPEVREGISATLSDLSSTITWIDSRDELEFEENGSITGGGVLITLGNIHRQESGEVNVGGSIYVGSLAAGGRTYVLENQDGTWAITGTTGMEWIS